MINLSFLSIVSIIASHLKPKDFQDFPLKYGHVIDQLAVSGKEFLEDFNKHKLSRTTPLKSSEFGNFFAFLLFIIFVGMLIIKIYSEKNSPQDKDIKKDALVAKLQDENIKKDTLVAKLQDELAKLQDKNTEGHGHIRHLALLTIKLENKCDAFKNECDALRRKANELEKKLNSIKPEDKELAEKIAAEIMQEKERISQQYQEIINCLEKEFPQHIKIPAIRKHFDALSESFHQILSIKISESINFSLHESKSVISSTPPFLESKKERTPQTPIPIIEGLIFKSVSGLEGNCLYLAVGRHLHPNQRPEILRTFVADYLEKNEPIFLNAGITNRAERVQYIKGVRGSKWADHLEIEALMYQFNRPIIIIRPDGKVANPQAAERSGIPIFVYYNNTNHYGAFDIQDGYTPYQVLQRLLNNKILAKKSSALSASFDKGKICTN